MMNYDKQSQGFLLTIFKPEDERYGMKYHAETIVKTVEREIDGLIYLAWAKEIASIGGEHAHCFIQFENPICFRKIKQFWPEAHIDCVKNEHIVECRDYVFKITNKYNKGNHISIRESFYEIGLQPSSTK